MRSPTARTLDFFRKQGATAEVVEKWINIPNHPGGGIRRDLWGADILVRQGALLMAIQSTSGSNHAHRVTKSLGNEAILNWLHCRVAFYVYSWAKKGPRGKRKVWTPKITQLVENNGKVAVL
jgi:hypothetical protein